MVEYRGNRYPIFDFTAPKKSQYLIFEVLGMPVGKNFSDFEQDILELACYCHKKEDLTVI
jgi:hypothetical protein